MNERERIREAILASRAAAASHIEAIRTAPELSYELVHQEIREYILAKFHLKDADCVTDNFRELTEISLSKSMQISPELVKEFDLARSCDGVTSQTAKMVLLFLALQRDLDITFDPMSTAEAETLSDISTLVWEQLQKRKKRVLTPSEYGRRMNHDTESL
ncbi:MAG: hypothetical protein IKO00_15730 [Oscillospiraceae bacterium]|nr:hypothetical protein [Oscillospiraceae bacterium]